MKSLRFMGFQPFEALPDVLGSADVLVAILEADAGVFSVPSKVLSYFSLLGPFYSLCPRRISRRKSSSNLAPGWWLARPKSALSVPLLGD